MSFSLAGYEKLAPDGQLFVSANLERVERGLPAIAVLTRSLDKVAQVGAVRDTDPPLSEVPGTLPGGGRWVSLGGNWAGGFDNALGSDHGWMYDDRDRAVRMRLRPDPDRRRDDVGRGREAAAPHPL